MIPTGAEDPNKIRIKLDDLEQIQPLAHGGPGEAQSYGSVFSEASAADPASTAAETAPNRASWLMRSWVYLGIAGLLGAAAAWGICEPWFRDGGQPTWANVLLFPLMLVLTCAGFGIAESIVDRSPKRAAIRGLLSLALGTVLGFFLNVFANLIFGLGLAVLRGGGGYSVNSPGLWLVRAIGWTCFGIGGGLVYGIVGQSGKRCLYGVFGGMIGAGIGGLLFDPISILVGGAAASRGVGMALFGAATGIAIGLVENALKDRWLYVSAGPLAGKQFILYKPLSTIGSSNSSDLYLFKDPAVQPLHARIELHGPRVVLRPLAPLAVNGRASGETFLRSGDYVQIGRYGFHFRERERPGQ